MEKKVSSYIYVISLFSILILVYSIWILLAAFKSYKEGNIANFYLQFFIGLIGLVLSLSSISRLKKRLDLLKEKMMKIVSVVLCNKCGFKVVRRFEVGDYVNKQVGKCQQCDGTMFIDLIYAEKP
jgi:hypothetical protein